MGLGAFSHLPDFCINYKLLIELVRSYDVFTNTISTSVGEFFITSEKVGFTFRLNCSGDLFEKRKADFEDKLNDEEKEALNLFKGSSLTEKALQASLWAVYSKEFPLPNIFSQH
ncbi:hypothetical protein PIB30_103716 [Stylosanthes scabra]|uniref:Uncharacterized protein n=1 Tax=Stylosanthes scabra TaxID=79078 RepID=A0ABU6XX28_9FABA|nr:hypothetical protein [Stylosanthes scabra]